MGELREDLAARYRLWMESPVFDEKPRQSCGLLPGTKWRLRTGFTGIWSLEPAACGEYWEPEATG